MKVETSGYEFASGKSPRGRGMWAFGYARVTPVEHVFWFNGLYAEAKAAALVHAKEQAWPAVWVQS
jgi:hypothetical protein